MTTFSNDAEFELAVIRELSQRGGASVTHHVSGKALAAGSVLQRSPNTRG